jgi:hypothetical protein
MLVNFGYIRSVGAFKSLLWVVSTIVNPCTLLVIGDQGLSHSCCLQPFLQPHPNHLRPHHEALYLVETVVGMSTHVKCSLHLMYNVRSIRL